MSFHTFIEDILKTGPKDLNAYKMSTQLFWVLTVKNIQNYLTKVNKAEYLSVIKSKVVNVIPEAEDSISLVNFRRIPSYIEFYNPNNKNCIRIILSTLGKPVTVVCFYSDYEKNNKNNHLGKETKMINEIIGPSHMTQDDQFIEKLVLFLLGSKDTPYATNVLQNDH